jgi:hypothetical protein
MMIHNVYEKAIDEPIFGDMFGDLCIKLSQHVQGNSFVKIIESDEEPPTEDGGTEAPASGGNSSTHIVYRWSNDVSTSDGEVVGPFSSPEKVIEVALDPELNEQAPIEREDMVLELEKLVIKNGIFIKIMKKKEPEEGEEDIFYTVYFPVANHEECGQQLSEIFLSERECVSDASKQNRFKHSLLNKCEDEFNKQDIYADWKAEKKAHGESKSSLTDKERADKDEDLEFRRIKIKKQMLGNIKFIGQLYKKSLLKEKIMRYCIASLLEIKQKDEPGVKNPAFYDPGEMDLDEEDHEAICSMFTTIGATIDQKPAADFMNVCFKKIKKLSNYEKLPSRSRFMYKDLIELRQNNWVHRRKQESAKTLDEIRKEVEREERQHAQQAAQANNSGGYNRGGRNDRNDYGGRGGGGGRGDRGDFRSNQNRTSVSSSNRPRQPKPATQTDDDGFTTIGTGASKTKPAVATTAEPSRSAPVVEPKQPVAAIAVDSTPAKSSSSVAPLSKEKFERKVKSMRGEYMQDPSNTEELLLTWDELSGTPDVGTQFVSVNADCFMDIKDNERKAIIDMLTTLVEKGKLSSSDVRSGLMDTIEFIDSLVCDAPKAYAYLGDILCAMFLVKVIDVDWLCEQCEKTKASLAENPEKIIKALVGSIEAAKGKDRVKEILGSSAKSLATLLGDKWGEVSSAIL